MRSAYVTRKTNETNVSVFLSIDQQTNTIDMDGKTATANGEKNITAEDCNGTIDTGCGFLNHMLTLFAVHSGFGLTIRASGDTDVDYHHLTEDIGITLGRCFKDALGDCRGIARYGSILLPMDEALVLIALDISGRSHLTYDVAISAPKVGDFDTELAYEFMSAFSRSLGITLHVRMLSGTNAHHIIEAIFKGLGRSLRKAISIEMSPAVSIEMSPAVSAGTKKAEAALPPKGPQIPSSKGSLFD